MLDAGDEINSGDSVGTSKDDPEPRFILHQTNTELSLQNGQIIKMCLLEILQRSLSGWSRILLLILNMNIDSAAATAQVSKY